MGNREAIAASMEVEHGKSVELIRDPDAIVSALAEIKHLKADYLESDNSDDAIGEKLETLNDRVKASIEAIKSSDSTAAQEIMARGYKEAGFNSIDLHEMGFDDAANELLSAKMDE